MLGTCTYFKSSHLTLSYSISITTELWNCEWFQPGGVSHWAGIYEAVTHFRVWILPVHCTHQRYWSKYRLSKYRLYKYRFSDLFRQSHIPYHVCYSTSIFFPDPEFELQVLPKLLLKLFVSPSVIFFLIPCSPLHNVVDFSGMSTCLVTSIFWYFGYNSI